LQNRVGFQLFGIREGENLSASSSRPVQRCLWAESDPLLRAYHDEEWGVPEYDSRRLWEALMLDGFQAGLSWTIILRKRDAFRRAFKNFDPEKVARFGKADVIRLLENPAIVRSRAKIEATIAGARIYLGMQTAGEDFARLSGASQAESQFKTRARFLLV
jgi:DNA-3-methyladenine glycosylase I